MALSKKDIETIVIKYFRDQFAIKDVQWSPTHNNLSTFSEEPGVDRFVNILNTLTSNFRSTEGYSQMREKVETVIPSLDNFPVDSWDESGYAVFSGIAELLFSEGIKWSHILTLFAFTFELASEFVQLKDDLTLVENIANWLITFLSERLLMWINNHGGSNGLIEYFNNSNSGNNFSDLRLWKRAFLVTGVLAIISFSIQLFK